MDNRDPRRQQVSEVMEIKEQKQIHGEPRKESIGERVIAFIIGLAVIVI